jgi:pSer/pThr/pTyr-binding forkhead associated (FHA) protein
MACLIVIDGPATGAHFALEDHNMVIVGRDEDCTFQIVDAQISRHHLQLRRDLKGQHFARDFQSVNGVMLNSVKIVGETPLVDGDELQIGRSRVVYSTADYPDAEAAMLSRRGDQWKSSTIRRGPD